MTKHKRYMSTRWSAEEKELLKSLWDIGSSFEQIAQKLNELIQALAEAQGMDVVPIRTPRAVALQCERLSMIEPQELRTWETQQTVERRRARARDRTRIHKEVLERDRNQCTICGTSVRLAVAHIIPFEQTRSNVAMELVTLCEDHHRQFDRGSRWCVQGVFAAMTSFYSDYSDKYAVQGCGSRHFQIKKKSPHLLDEGSG